MRQFCGCGNKGEGTLGAIEGRLRRSKNLYAHSVRTRVCQNAVKTALKRMNEIHIISPTL